MSIYMVYNRANTLGLGKSAAFMASDKAGRIQKGRTDPRMKATQFPKGHVPANKGTRRPGYAPGRMASTQFKKGRPVHEARNYVPIGTERLSKDGYLERKVTDDHPVPARRWVGVHRLLWEKHHGPIPKGHVIVFIDGNKKNIAIGNLQLITLRQNMRRNSLHNLPPEVVKVVQLRGALMRQINKREKANHVDH